MFSSFRNLIKAGSKSLIPILSVSLLTLHHKNIFNSVQQNAQQQLNASSSIDNNDISRKLNERHQNWEWDRIIQINSPQQLTQNDVLQKTIICYQMTGKKQIDSQVALISHLFCDKFFGKVSQRFQFVFLTPNPNYPQMQDQLFYVIFTKDGSKYVPLKNHINSNPQKRKYIPDFNSVHQRLIEIVNKYHQISLNNIYNHLQHIGTQGRDTYQLVVIPQNNSQTQINKSKKALQRFLKNKEIWNSQIIKSIVVDDQSRTILGLNKKDVQKNKVYLIAPKNQNIIEQNQANDYFKIQNKSYLIVPGQQIQNKFVFPPIPPKLSTQSYILKINVDLNQTKPEMIDGIYQIMRSQKVRNLKDVPKLLTFSKNDQSIEISIQKNNHDTIVQAYEQGCRFQQNYKRNLLIGANTWKYPYDYLHPQKLEEFIKIVTKKEQQLSQEQKNIKAKLQFYKSQQQQQAQRKYSRLIVGQQRKSTIQGKGDKVIFHYSKSCHSCKRFKGVYEEIAHQSKDVAFYRIDNDTNKSEGLVNYNSTPIFVMYKDGYPRAPWYFKMPYFTKSLFTNFVEITKQVKVIDSSMFFNHIEDHVKNQSLVKQTLKEFL